MAYDRQGFWSETTLSCRPSLQNNREGGYRKLTFASKGVSLYFLDQEAGNLQSDTYQNWLGCTSEYVSKPVPPCLGTLLRLF